MDKEKLIIQVDMTGFRKKIANYDYAKLAEEKEKIAKKMNVNYIYVDTLAQNAETIRANISTASEEKNRVWVKRKIEALIVIINSLLPKDETDYSDVWRKINNKFAESTYHHTISAVKIKRSPFANRLSLDGLTAYKRYLLFINEQLEKGANYKPAIDLAIEFEKDADKDLDREKFYSNFFLPNSIDAIFHNLMREKIITEKMQELGNVKKVEKEQTK